MSKLVEKTVISRKNVIVMGFVVIFFFAWVAITFWGWVRYGILRPTELGFLVILLVVLIERVQARYIYETDARDIRITKDGLLGHKTYEVSYRQIMGIYQYKAQLVSILKFRRTFRLHSALDNRKVWVIAYKVSVSGKKEHNERIYFKPSDEMLQFLSAKIPGKVMISENQVVVEAIQKEK
jgi:hypothetical protein